LFKIFHGAFQGLRGQWYIYQTLRCYFECSFLQF